MMLYDIFCFISEANIMQLVEVGTYQGDKWVKGIRGRKKRVRNEYTRKKEIVTQVLNINVSL
jgi:hypothetical protein